MHEEHNVFQYQFFKKIDSLCVTLCTDDKKFIDEDSHFIHIPKQLFIELTNNTNINTMCFEITNPLNPLNKIFIKKIEPSMGDFETYIWLPNWICEKLQIQSIGDKINFVPVINPQVIKRIKIQGNLSSYVKTNIKNLLELKLEHFRCINLNENFHIGEVIFKVKELYSKSEEQINFGIITNEIEIDFETPEDIQFLEKKNYIMSIMTNSIDKILNNKKNKKTNEKKTGIFNFATLINEKNNDKNNLNLNEIINLDEINDEIILKIKNIDYKFENISNPNNIKLSVCDLPLIAEIIEEGKILMSKMSEEYKLKNNIKSENCCESKESKNKKNIIEYFKSTPYKLTNSAENNQKSIDEIRKLRLENINKQQKE